MQEEVTQKTIAFVIKATKLDADILKAAMQMYLKHHRNQAEKKHGKISYKKLMGCGEGASSIEITDKNIKLFERYARKYHVDFAVKKDKISNPPRYLVFFHGRDTDVIAQAFKEFVNKNEKNRRKPSLQVKLKRLLEQVQKTKQKERLKEKNRTREEVR